MNEDLPPLRLLIVDDEAPARERTRRMLAKFKDTELIGEAATGSEALAKIESLDPDVVLLDIQMPDLDGLRVLEALDDPPAVIFATAFEQHAVRAFDLEAVDYCLKPFSAERLRRALNRARRYLARQALPENQPNDGPTSSVMSKIPALLGRVTERVDLERIVQFEIAEGVVFLHRDDGETLICEQTLCELEDAVPSERFCRISRQAIINIDFVRSYEPAEQGGLRIHLGHGLVQTVSRRRARPLRARLLGR